jgi:hypothetical protein
MQVSYTIVINKIYNREEKYGKGVMVMSQNRPTSVTGSHRPISIAIAIIDHHSLALPPLTSSSSLTPLALHAVTLKHSTAQHKHQATIHVFIIVLYCTLQRASLIFTAQQML